MPFADVRRLDIDQLNVLATEIAKQSGEELISLTNIVAAGASTGFTGSDKPLKAIAKAVRGEDLGTGIVADLRTRMKNLAQKKNRNGPDSR